MTRWELATQVIGTAALSGVAMYFDFHHLSGWVWPGVVVAAWFATAAIMAVIDG